MNYILLKIIFALTLVAIFFALGYVAHMPTVIVMLVAGMIDAIINGIYSDRK